MTIILSAVHIPLLLNKSACIYIPRHGPFVSYHIEFDACRLVQTSKYCNHTRDELSKELMSCVEEEAANFSFLCNCTQMQRFSETNFKDTFSAAHCPGPETGSNFKLAAALAKISELCSTDGRYFRGLAWWRHGDVA